MLDAGRIYECFETPVELDLKRKKQLNMGKPPVYDRAGLNLSAEDIAKLRAEGRDLIIVTHNMGFARQVSDYCVFIADGRAVEEGLSAEVFSRPRTPELVNFLAKVLRY